MTEIEAKEVVLTREEMDETKQRWIELITKGHTSSNCGFCLAIGRTYDIHYVECGSDVCKYCPAYGVCAAPNSLFEKFMEAREYKYNVNEQLALEIAEWVHEYEVEHFGENIGKE